MLISFVFAKEKKAIFVNGICLEMVVASGTEYPAT